ncbi:CxxxxCH/CxxCH domain-containing protein [Geobacter hydrogenophilus]|uniref:CxxxxCH/CxxCH domain-containing protein n=1 Tax=Geobacter hydrogenophilus TaxID=40983 RepID=A0A9W6G146_9BACT|nr:CxxxxCH/CxxCH domain-containing protein [Geobacter hydrogenophilus]MBT0894116.1 CxxxxCH/CxxCH domain-containing protein [Geobacter hydrogenophilus]GLI38601.1 hypothetical protein GHYDROH2_21020 [Geobacter hydrogenophilus]
MKPIIAALAAMISATLLTVTIAGASMQCYDCHGTSSIGDYRPVDAAYRNISTGGFRGNHQTHMGTGASSANCALCHGGGVTSYLNSHRNGQVSIAANINNSPATGTYSRGTSFAQSTNPTLGTCATVNCHFEAATPTWGADPALTTCSTCHGAAPADGSHPATSGSGKKHGDYYGLTTSSCAKCHPDHTAEAKPFAHATSAGNRALVVAFITAPNSGFGRYTGNTNYPNYLPSQSPPRNGTCKNLYCHSPGNKASNVDLPNTTATWGGSLTCKGCHKADIASGSVITSGSHQSHVNGMGIGYTQIKCVKCHGATVNSSMTIVNTANHVDKQVTVAFNNTSSAANGSYNGQLAKPATPSTKVPGSATGQCTTVYCHSSGQGDGGTWPPTYQTPTWGTASTGQCGTCHGIQTKHDATGFGYGTPTPMTTGSHTRHLVFQLGTGNVSAERKCAACHSYTLTGYSPNACSSASCHTGMVQKHANYEINVGIPDFYGATATYNTANLTPGAGYSSCSNVYCHSDGKATPTAYATPTWGNAASGSCGTCHGVTAAAPPASTPHVKHVGSASVYLYKCALCHSGKVQVTANSTVAPAFTNLTTHVNKMRDVKFDATSPFGTYTSVTQSCRNVYCHSVGNTNVTAGALPGVYGGKIYTRQTWSGTLSCNGCHGRSTASGMPDYTNGGVGTTANTHPKHVTDYSISCGECHSRTTKNGTTIRTNSPSIHVNTSREVFFNLSSNLSKLGSYDAGQKSCSSVGCHSNGRGTYQVATWGEADDCGYCHPLASLGGAHAKHVDLTQVVMFYTYTANRSTADGYNFGCSTCHPLVNSSHVMGGTIVLDLRPGIANVGTLRAKNRNTITASGPAGTANGGTTADSVSGSVVKCLNIYCHSNGYASNPVYATTPNWYGGTFAGDKCASCHGNSPNSTIAGSPAHYNADFAGPGNAGGHVVGIHYDNIFTGTVGQATPGALGTSSHGNPVTSTSFNCDTCHFATVEARSNDKNVVCVACHNGANLRGDATIANHATHVDGTPTIQFDAIQVRSKAQMKVQMNYTTAFTRVGGYKTSGAYDIAKTPLDTATMWNGATKTCSNVSCHFNKPISWTNTGTAYKCRICHDGM